MENPIDKEKVKSLLLDILKQENDQKSIEWLLQQKVKIEQEASYLKFYMAFGQASRYFRRYPLSFTEEQKQEVASLKEGLSIHVWDQLKTARIYLLLHFEEKDASEWMKVLNRLFETSDMHEQESLYAALPLMPFPNEMLDRAIEGLRSNITSVFDAVALNNPFPANYFDERAWNQMVLKAVFMQRPLYQIQKADQRSNPELASILVDFAHERWAAGRAVMPELWRFVGPHLKENNKEDIQKILTSNDPLQEKAALLACTQSPSDVFMKFAESKPDITTAIQKGDISWESIGKEYERINKA